MKHPIRITIIFVLLFVTSQLLGLIVLSQGVSEISYENNQTQIGFEDTAAGERPNMSGLATLVYIVVGVSIGTLILLYFARTQRVRWWKAWFFVAVWMSISITLGVFIQAWLAWLIGFFAAALKLWKNNPWTHNITELLIYPGLAFFIVPILDMVSVFILLIAVSAYDAYAVWKSKHMVEMAEFTTSTNVFPGLNINYSDGQDEPVRDEPSDTKKGSHSGVLGGGDIAVPMLFTGTTFTMLVEKGFTIPSALSWSSIIVATSALSLALLFYYSKKKTFYPAMPFLSAGCFFGYIIVRLFIG